MSLGLCNYFKPPIKLIQIKIICCWILNIFTIVKIKFLKLFWLRQIFKKFAIETDEFKIENVTPQNETDKLDLIKISKAAKDQMVAAQFETQISDDLESVYSFEGFLSETAEEQPSNQASDDKPFVVWDQWSSFLDILRFYARIYV